MRGSNNRAFLTGASIYFLIIQILETSAVEAKQPIRRFGESEFRLTAKGGDDRRFCFSPDGKLLSGANWEGVRIWSFPEGKLLHDFSNVVQTNCIAFAADGKEFVVLEQRRMEIYRFDVAKGELLTRVKLRDVEV